MGVALENARLFDETKHLLDRDERAGRRAVGDQRGRRGARPAARIPGDHRPRRRTGADRSSTAARSSSRSTTRTATRSPSRTTRTKVSHSTAARSRSVPGSRRPCCGPVARSALGRSRTQIAAGALQVGGSDTKSWLGAPIPAGNRVIGVIGLESLDENAFTEADERLPQHAGGEPRRRARERPPVRRDAAPAHRDQRAGRRAGPDQRRPARARREARHAGDVRPGRRPDPGDLRCPGRRHRDPRPRDGPRSLPVLDRARRALPGRADPAPQLPPDRHRDRAADADRRGRARWPTWPPGNGHRPGRAAEVRPARAARRPARRPRA